MVISAGIVVYKRQGDKVEVLLAHPGGPFWAKKDSWLFPKGEVDEGEDELEAAKREFREELGFGVPGGELIDLGAVKQDSKKTNRIWAVEGDIDLAAFTCDSTFTIEWPPKTGKQQEFPEVDKISWFDLSTAKQKLFKAQGVFIDRLAEKLDAEVVEPPEQAALF
jgi:predicted NUDIX family NTP pyrophosphohydrolase